MEVTVIEKTKRYTVSGSQTTKRYEVNGVQTVKRFTLQIAELGKRGYSGKSAYELALSNGFLGTEAQWLASLKGEPANLAVLGNYERDWAQDFMVALNT